MAGLPVPEFSPPPATPRGSAWQVYMRLLRHAWVYKGRLLVSLLFSILIAASFGTMLVSVGTVVKLTFYEAPEEPDPGHIDPGERLANDIRSTTDRLRGAIGWAPESWDEGVLSLVAGMREEPMRALKYACVIVFALATLIGIARLLQEFFAGQVCTHITADLGEAMYVNLMRQPLGFFESRTSGDILSRFTNDIFMVNNGLSAVFVKLMREPIKALTFLVIAVSVSPGLTLVGLCVLPPIGFALGALGLKVRKSVRRSLQKIGSMASVVSETVRGIIIVKGYSMEEYETRRVIQEIAKLRRFLMKTILANAATGPITEFILVIGLIFFVLLSGQRVVSGTLDAGDLLQLYFALAMMLDPVRKLSAVNNMIQTSIASAERVFEFMDLEPDIVEAPDAVELPPLREAIRFENVTFAYDGRTAVLHDLDLDIPRGEMVALVGFSGAGKSTVAKLIPRFYDVTAGRITFDGIDIRRATFASLRDQISIVTQDTVLFNESIRDNIAFGRASYPDERVREAARAANALGFIEELPKRFDTHIGEAGGSLSGGQRQRLAIARAMIKDPAILILDEATSSLDSQSEQLIQDALDQFVEGRTTIIIAHRLSTIQRASRIVVFDKGRIVEQGTHAELLERKGMYKRLYDVQFAPGGGSASPVARPPEETAP